MRVAPASIIAKAVARSRMPPDAFTPARCPTVSRMSWTCPTVAPPGPKPVPVLTKCASASTARLQAAAICSSLK